MEEPMKNENSNKLPIVSDHINVGNMLVSDKPIKTAREAIDLVMGEIYGRAEKITVAIFCDDNLMPLYTATIDRGETPQNRTFIPKDIVQTALLHDASYVMLLYSHPGLSSKEEMRSFSEDDIAITKAIADACNRASVNIYDSIVISSFKESPSAEPEPVYFSIMEKCSEDF